jgi:hypothetical protein
VLTFYGQNTVIQHVMPLALQDKAVFNSMAHLACMNLESLRENPKSGEVAITKGMAVHSLVKTLSTSKETYSSLNLMASGCVAVSANVSIFAYHRDRSR